MSCRTVTRLSLLASGATLVATTAFAVPADVGRTADVFANAIRYQVAARPTVSGPKMRPDTFSQPTVVAEISPFDPTPFAKVDEAFEVTLEAVDLGPRWISAFTDDDVFALPLNRAGIALANIPIAPKEDEVHGESLVATPVVALNIPTQFKEDELFSVALAPIEADVLSIAVASEEDAFETPAQPAALATADTPPAPFEQTDEVLTAEVLEAAATVVEDTLGANSSSRTDADDADLMSQMADADENLVMRDGGEDGVDTMMMSSDVLFSFGSATLADDALATLASIGDMANDVPVIQVFGHTDAIGSEANNLRLGQERAEAVRDWLLANTAFTEDRVIATGIGEVDPVAPNVNEAGQDSPDGRAQNRRVEFAFHEAGYVPE